MSNPCEGRCYHDIREETDGKFMDSGDYICVEEGMSMEEVLAQVERQTSDMTMGM